MLAGILFGVLTFKPHLGLLLPVALVAGRHWRSVVAAALTALPFAAVVGRLFRHRGLGRFPRQHNAHPEHARERLELWPLLQDAIGFRRGAASRIFNAGRLQPTGACRVGRGGGCCVGLAAAAGDPDMKNATLMAATPLSTAFVFDYDLMLLAPAIAWLTRKAVTDRALPYERTALVAAFLAPFVSRVVGMYTHLLLAPIVIAALLMVIIRRIHATEK